MHQVAQDPRGDTGMFGAQRGRGVRGHPGVKGAAWGADGARGVREAEQVLAWWRQVWPGQRPGLSGRGWFPGRVRTRVL